MYNKDIDIPIWNKYMLTREEAMEYFNIGEKKMRKIINDHLSDNSFVFSNGRKTLIIREKFEEFIKNTSAI